MLQAPSIPQRSQGKTLAPPPVNVVAMQATDQPNPDAHQIVELHSATHPGVAAQPHVLAIENFSLHYGPKQALYSVSMNIPKSKITALIGPSGCGKYTLLRSINRLNDLIDGIRLEGTIRYHHQNIYAGGLDVINLRKCLGMVFQKSNPFPMSIFENVVYSLRIDGVRQRSALHEAAERALRGAALWEEVKDRLKESALSLSGGQQQRLCIARAIAAQPEVLLMDEPCSALDPVATSKIEDLMLEIKERYTIIIVTHNMQQASRASDFTAFMNAGRLVEYGPTIDIFTKPQVKETSDYITGRFG